MSNSIFDGNIWDLRTGNDGEVEDREEEAVVGEVVDAISDENDADASNLFELLSRMKGIMGDDDDDTEESDEENNMDANDYHNKAFEYARH